ncbi:hypothetical protein GCM10007390_42470 [Persicitalea jodogahamensis]|uniref:SbsA Ig-like domain-containing protein n=1 Tax=Persicitalea jodogahamensis TaxID=402147 RepID=A0A8J3GBM7_9BACT|nr:hypothetical protein GCM10007390_42470 [Persicitalea jodogahamensis]
MTVGLPSDSVASLLKVRLVDSDPSVSILGDYSVESKTISFTPLIPFTRGLQYEVLLRNAPVGTFAVPAADPADAPELLGIFPSQDTLPENLLKIYLRFSQPMQEGKSADYVALISNNADTLKGAFLNLQPELWNEDRTVLTLWLDPGRIKRDLQPNRVLGNPLQRGVHYQLLVSSEWKNKLGASLPKTYDKSFVAGLRDSLSPVPAKWKIMVPSSGTRQSTKVEFNEPLDYSLLAESLSILDKNGRVVKGKWEIGEDEKAAHFKPLGSWQAGNYTLQVLTILEDLAGNNLNRPFDLDVTKKRAGLHSDEVIKVPFSVAD